MCTFYCPLRKRGTLFLIKVLPNVYICPLRKNNEGTDIHIWQYFFQKDLKLLSAIILLCLGNKSKKPGCKIIAFSLEQTFYRVILFNWEKDKERIEICCDPYNQAKQQFAIPNFCGVYSMNVSQQTVRKRSLTLSFGRFKRVYLRVL